jgi:hypothetical protein
MSSLLLSRCSQACWSLFPASGVQTAACHIRDHFCGGPGREIADPGRCPAALRDRLRHLPRRKILAETSERPATAQLHAGPAPHGHPPPWQDTHDPGIEHPRCGSTPTRRASPDPVCPRPPCHTDDPRRSSQASEARRVPRSARPWRPARRPGTSPAAAMARPRRTARHPGRAAGPARDEEPADVPKGGGGGGRRNRGSVTHDPAIQIGITPAGG